MSYVTLRPPEEVSGVQIDNTWWNYVYSVHDRNFYYKDLYIFPVVGFPIAMSGRTDTGVAKVDVYLGQSKIASVPTDTTDDPDVMTFSFLVPPQDPGEAELRTVAFDASGNEAAKGRTVLLFTNYAAVMWPFYVEALRDYTLVGRVEYPRLSQEKITPSDIEAWYLQVTKIPRAAWGTDEAARAFAHMAAQALYGRHVTVAGLKDYLLSYFGSMPVVGNPVGWTLGGTNYQYQETTSESSVTFSGPDLISASSRSVAYGDPITISYAGNSVTITGTKYPGSAGMAEVQVLSDQFKESPAEDDGFADWIGVVEYVPADEVWNDYGYEPDPADASKIYCGTSWASGGGVDAVAASIATAFTGAFSATMNLSAYTTEVPGRVMVRSTQVGSSQHTNYVIVKGGPDPMKVPLAIVNDRVFGAADSDSVVVNGLSAGPITDYGALFLGRDINLSRPIREGTTTFMGHAKPWGVTGSFVSVADRFRTDSYQYTQEIQIEDFLEDTSGDYTGVVGHWFATADYPMQEVLAYDTGPVISPEFVGANVIDFTDTPGATAGVASYDVTETASCTQDPLGDLTGVRNGYYLNLEQPVEEVLSLDGVTSPLRIVGDRRVYVGTTDLGTVDVEYRRKPFTVTYYRQPTVELDEAVSRVSPAFYPYTDEVDPARVWKDDSTLLLYCDDLSDFFSLTVSATGFKLVPESELNYGCWLKEKTTVLLQDAACQQSVVWLRDFPFSVGDELTIGRDVVAISSYQEVQYYGYKVYLASNLSEQHYRGETAYVDETMVLEYQNAFDFVEISYTKQIPAGKSVHLDVSDARFGESEREVYVQWSDDGSTFSDWELLPYPYQLRSADLDTMRERLSESTDEYIPWWTAKASGSAFSISYDSDTPPGHYPDGCTVITGSGSDSYDGVQKVFPQGCFISGEYISLYAKSQTGSADVDVEYSTWVPLEDDDGYPMEYGTETFTVGDTWTQVDLNPWNYVSEVRVPYVRSIRVRTTSGGPLMLGALSSDRRYRYFRVKVVVYNAKRGEDYVLTRLGLRTMTDKRHPEWPASNL